MNNTMQLYIDDNNEVKGYPITTPDRVIDENGVSVKKRLKNNVKFDIVGKGEGIPGIDGKYDDTEIKKQINTIDTKLDTNINQINDIKDRRIKGLINIYEFGFIGDGKSHPLSESYTSLSEAKLDYPSATQLTDEKDWCALQYAFTVVPQVGYMSGKGAMLKLPSCRAIINKPLRCYNIGLIGDSLGTELHFERFNISSETTALLIDFPNSTESSQAGGNPQLIPTFENILFTADGKYKPLGDKGTNINGIEIRGDARANFINCTIKWFNKGCVWNNNGGWFIFDRCLLAENYYNIYVKQNNGDYRLNHTNLTKARFANFATNSSCGVQGLVWRGGHCGFAPYGFYCEPVKDGVQNRNQFLKDVHLDHVRFEGIGNGAIISDYTNNENPEVTGLIMENVGFDWVDSFKLPNRPREYAVDLGKVCSGGVIINPGGWKFKTGDLGVFRIRDLQANFTAYNYNDDAVTILKKTEYSVVSLGQTTATKYADNSIQMAYNRGSVCKLLNAGESFVFSPAFQNNPSKRYRFNIMTDGGQAYGSFFHDGSSLIKVGEVGIGLVYNNNEISEQNKWNIYPSKVGELTIKNLTTSNRKVYISVEAFS